jgi:hypothetical protein
MIALPTLPPEATDSRLRAFYEYWRSRAPDGRLPGRQHIDPLDVPALLPDLVLFDVVRQGEGENASLRFRVRVAGGTLVELVGGTNPTGRFIDEFVPANRRGQLNGAYASVVRERIAHYWESQLWTEGREFVRVQRLALPLARDGASVDMVIGCYARVEQAPPDGAAPRRAATGGAV